jgi:hypothetical protein
MTDEEEDAEENSKGSGYKTIMVPDEVKERVKAYKSIKGINTMEDVVTLLCDYYDAGTGFPEKK